MKDGEGGDRSQVKKRLLDLLKTAVGGVIVAGATCSTPTVEAAPAGETTVTVEERAQGLRDAVAAPDLAKAPETSLVAFNNWGNHWNKWDKWNKWPNWHNW